MLLSKAYTTLVLLCLCCAFGCTSNRQRSPSAIKGTINISHESFRNEIRLNGQWLFNWKEFVDPNDRSTFKGVYVNFPFKWNGYKLNGYELPAFGYASYRLTVALPLHHKPLRMAMPDVYCAYRLYMNGQLVAENGKVSRTPAGFMPHWQYRSVDLPENTDTIRLVLHVANFVHSKGGIKESIIIGQRDILELKRQRAASIDLLLTGCLFMGGLFFLGLYLLGSRDKAILLFSLYSIVYSYRLIGIENYVLHTLLPDLSWYLAVRLEYVTLFLGVALFGSYTWHLYPKDVNRLIVNIISLICFSFSVASLVLPPLYFTQLVNPFLVVMVFCLVYVPIAYSRAYRNRRPGSVYALLSSLALMLVFAISLFHYWGLIPPFQLVSFGCYVSFFFLQSLILSYRVSFVLKQARKEAEQGLVAKSEFLSTMSHEIRTPLNSVIGMSHLLLKNDPRPDQAEQLDVMLFSANNLLSIVNDILDYNKIEAGKVSFEHIEMDVSMIARNIVSGMRGSAHDKGIELNLLTDNKLATKVIGDPTRLSQVITNLVHNAIKFTVTGSVNLDVSVMKQNDNSVTLSFAVRDTGIGISPEKQQLIFERFTQADSSTSRGFGGTGLGLAISKRILELQNVQLQVISETGKGSTFYFIQAFEKSSPVESAKLIENLPNEEDKPLNGVAILLVEDNPMNVLVAKSYLQRWGATIDVASNGLEGLEKLDTSRHKLVLMDLQMPVMDGFESARNMRTKGVTLPIVALTANIPMEIEEKVAESGIDDIVVKPFLPDELYRKVLFYIFSKEARS